MSVLSRRHSPLPHLLLLLMVSACAGTPPREDVTPAQAHMYAHFDRAGEVHDALVRGELEMAREGAKWMATHQDSHDAPPGSGQHSALMQMYATRIGQASDLDAAAEATAQMGRVCGDCHRDNGVTPRFLMGTAPPEGGTPEAEMALHVWAAERMWEGLVGPDDYAWRSGARSLTGGWLDPAYVVTAPADREKVRVMVQSVYEIGSRAEGVSEPEDRAGVYGEFLTTCIDCHRITGAIIR